MSEICYFNEGREKTAKGMEKPFAKSGGSGKLVGYTLIDCLISIGHAIFSGNTR